MIERIENTGSTTLTSRLELFLHDRMSHWSAFVFSVFAGRWLMSFWTGTAKIHELYTAACGLYVCWLTIRAVTVLVAWMPQGRRVIFQKVKEWSLMVGLSSQDLSCLTAVVNVFPVVSLNLFTLFLHCVDCVKKVDFFELKGVFL